MAFSLAVVDSVGDATLVPLWLPSPASEVALEGPTELATVFAPEPTFGEPFASPVRRIIFTAGCEVGAGSSVEAGFAMALRGVGLEGSD